ncbi:MAG: rod shape-determining protein MreD [Rhodobacteraceae bacterium]|nr:rod shape-determining protein MreD [Paracoccaceae bacterium]
MARPVISPRWAFRGLYVAIAVLLVLIRILPIRTLPTTLPGPDLLTCITLVWVLRRPDYVPVLLIAAVFLMEDFLLMRPPGLWAVIVLMGTEFLRSREALTRELGLAMEWAMVSTVMIGMVLVYRLAYAVAFLDEPQLSLVALQLLGSILCYPVVVGLSRALFGLRKAATGEVDALGRRM